MPERCSSSRSRAWWVLPVFVGPSRAITGAFMGTGSPRDGPEANGPWPFGAVFGRFRLTVRPRAGTRCAWTGPSGTRERRVAMSQTHHRTDRAPDPRLEGGDLAGVLFESNPQPAWIFDISTLRFLAVNAAASRCYDYEPAE